MTSVLPLGQRVLVKPDIPVHESHGLILPENVIVRPESGVIVAVSLELAGEFRVGTRVAFSRAAGIELSVDGEPRVVLGKWEILGVYANDHHAGCGEPIFKSGAAATFGPEGDATVVCSEYRGAAQSVRIVPFVRDDGEPRIALTTYCSEPGGSLSTGAPPGPAFPTAAEARAVASALARCAEEADAVAAR